MATARAAPARWPVRLPYQLSTASHAPQLLDDSDAKSRLEFAAKGSLMRPRAPDDSHEPLATWNVADAVDCWHEDGWWEVRWLQRPCSLGQGVCLPVDVQWQQQ